MQLPPSNNQLIRIFYGLLIAEIVTTGIAIPLGLFSGAVASAALEERGWIAPANDLDMMASGLSCLYITIIFPGLIISWVGLFNFWWWARWLYLGIAGLSILLAFPIGLFDFSFNWGIGDALSEFAQILTGINIAVVFLTSVANNFSREDRRVDA